MRFQWCLRMQIRLGCEAVGVYWCRKASYYVALRAPSLCNLRSIENNATYINLPSLPFSIVESNKFRKCGRKHHVQCTTTPNSGHVHTVHKHPRWKSQRVIHTTKVNKHVPFISRNPDLLCISEFPAAEVFGWERFTSFVCTWAYVRVCLSDRESEWEKESFGVLYCFKCVFGIKLKSFKCRMHQQWMCILLTQHLGWQNYVFSDERM